RALASAKVRVLSFDPVLARWAEDVEVVGVVERGRLVWHIRRDDQHLTCTHLVDLRKIVPETEAERTLDDERQLLCRMHMLWDARPFLEPDLGKHGLLAVNEPPLHTGHEVLAR